MRCEVGRCSMTCMSAGEIRFWRNSQRMPSLRFQMKAASAASDSLEQGREPSSHMSSPWQRVRRESCRLHSNQLAFPRSRTRSVGQSVV